MLKLATFVAAILVAAAPTAAFAHITLETQAAPVGSSYKAVFRVGHGCEGSPTVSIRVQIPEGVIAVKPMPKAGWTLETVTGAYQQPYNNHGASVTEGVTEVVWSGGSLPDGFYDEFALRATLTDSLEAGATLYFPVVQECEAGVARWIDIPAGSVEPEMPAPGVKLLPQD